jgi:hypothetical protein
MHATYPAAISLAPLATAALLRSFTRETLHNALHTYDSVSFLNNVDHLNKCMLVFSEHQYSPLPRTHPWCTVALTVFTTATIQATLPCSTNTSINTHSNKLPASMHLNPVIAATGCDRYLLADRDLTSIMCAKQLLSLKPQNTGQINASSESERVLFPI